MIGEKIKQARKNKGYTLKQLGEIIHISHAALSQIENNKTKAGRKTLIDLAQTLGENFGEDWLIPYLQGIESAPSKKEIVEKMTTKEFISLKFPDGKGRRSDAELEMLTKLLDARIATIRKNNV